MNCLIIAAGRGSRLFSQADPKPLIRLLGLSLIERVILTANSVGPNDDYYVVSGYNGEKVRQVLDNFRSSRNIHIHHLINEEWEKENGLSVLKAKNALNQNFILLMADHIFDESMLLTLKNQPIAEGEVILAVDYNIDSNKFVDPHDVTKVLVEGDQIVDIGKNIKTYNAYDTGVFLCSPAIFCAIEESVHAGDSSLTGGMRVLAQSKKAKAVDSKDAFWIDVDDELSLKKAESQLLSTLKKPSDGFISRYINRPLSTRITKQLLETKVTPNFVSFFSFLLSMLGAFFFFLGGYIPLVIGAGLAQISSVIDGCDGEIARLKFQMTEFGGWFDAVLDRYADGFLLLGLTYHVYSSNQKFLIIVIGFLAILGAFMNSYTAEKYDRFMQRKLGRGKHYLRMGRDLRMFIIFLGGLANQPLLILVSIALFMNTENIRRILVLYRNG